MRFNKFEVSLNTIGSFPHFKQFYAIVPIYPKSMNADELKSELAKIKEEKHLLLKLINHDIRSPFNRIFALLQLMEMESDMLDGNKKDYIHSMYLSTLSGLEMIRNLRDMREVDAEEVSLDVGDFELLEAINKSIRSFSKHIELKNQQILIHSTVDQTPIFSDEYYVQRVFENVLSNAIKFSKEGETIKIDISKNEQVYCIEIVDRGEGIKVQEEHLLFEKYKKLSSIASGGEGSLGLGLYNCSRYLEMLKGKISLRRNTIMGSAFRIELPQSI